MWVSEWAGFNIIMLQVISVCSFNRESTWRPGACTYEWSSASRHINSSYNTYNILLYVYVYVYIYIYIYVCVCTGDCLTNNTCIHSAAWRSGGACACRARSLLDDWRMMEKQQERKTLCAGILNAPPPHTQNDILALCTRLHAIQVRWVVWRVVGVCVELGGWSAGLGSINVILDRSTPQVLSSTCGCHHSASASQWRVTH